MHYLRLFLNYGGFLYRADKMLNLRSQNLFDLERNQLKYCLI